MSLTVQFNTETDKWKVNGRKVRRLRVSEGTRLFLKYGSGTLLKVDRDIPQSISEFHNYQNTPDKWKKYLAPALAVGVLPDECQYWEFDECRTFGWVLQKRIPILRLDEWRSAQYRNVSRRKALGIGYRDWVDVVNMRAQAMDDFAMDLIEAASAWYDAGQRQYSIVRGRVVAHDYASCEVRTEEDYRVKAVKWDKFDMKWGAREAELLSPIGVVKEVAV